MDNAAQSQTPWDPFPESLRHVIAAATRIAAQRNAESPGRWDLLTAISADDSSVGRIVAATVDFATASCPDVARDDPALGPGVYSRALELAREWGDTFISVGHLAVALLESPPPVPLRSSDRASIISALIEKRRESAVTLPPGWRVTSSAPHTALSQELVIALNGISALQEPGTRVTIAIETPNGAVVTVFERTSPAEDG